MGGGGGNTSSKGPSPTDPGIGGALQGGGGPSSMPVYGYETPAQEGPPTQGTVGEGIGALPGTQFGVTTSLDPSTTATAGTGSGGSTPGGIFSSLSDPSGGGGSTPLPGSTPLGQGGIHSDFVAAGGGFDPGVPAGTTSPAGGGGGGISAAGLAPPSGVGTGAPPDPTQAQAQKPATAGAAIPPAGGTSGFSFEKLLGGAVNSIAANPLGILAAAGGLGYSVMQPKQISEAQTQLQQQAGSLNAQGQQIMSYLTSGTLPAGLKAGLEQATAAARAKVISNYAAQGMSTDPTQNSALAQQLALIEQQAIITTAQIGQQLYSTGLQESGMASGLYTQLANLDQTQTGRIGQSIAAMASALNNRGGAPGTTVKIGG